MEFGYMINEALSAQGGGMVAPNGMNSVGYGIGSMESVTEVPAKSDEGIAIDRSVYDVPLGLIVMSFAVWSVAIVLIIRLIHGYGK